MKYLVTLILSISLYAPQVAKLLAYAECSALAITYADKYWCDCMLTADNNPDEIPATEKQKDIQLKTDWKFRIDNHFCMGMTMFDKTTVNNCFVITDLPSPIPQAVFHPPLA
ncbi:MAG: hypothetical protein ACN4EP_01330 [Sediminibacterium sp.]